MKIVLSVTSAETLATAIVSCIGVPQAALRCTVREFRREATIKTIDPETVLTIIASTQEGGRQMIPATICLRQNFSIDS